MQEEKARTNTRATRTINPLHFEDLEPHRFEDLVRQLAYKYRTWRYLDATGRLGRDGGLDIKGVELLTSVGTTTGSADDETAEGSPADGSKQEQHSLLAASPEEYPQVVAERQWSIQCKRYKEIGPTLMREVVAETVPDPENPPYGLIIAAACDVSADTLAVLRGEALARGVQEVHPWTKAHLEDMLFQPEHDHLLFAYFGISLSIRRQSRLTQLRSDLAIKRKLMRVIDQDSGRANFHADVLIRDVEDNSYPDFKSVPDFEHLRCPPWHVAKIQWFHPKGVIVWRYGYDGWVQPGGDWDLLEESRGINSVLGRQSLPKTRISDLAQEAWEYRTKLMALIPQEEQRHIREQWLLPYRNILEIDDVGDRFADGPHLFCRFNDSDGPYVGNGRFITTGSNYTGDLYLKRETRKPLFEQLKLRLAAEDVPEPRGKSAEMSKSKRGSKGTTGNEVDS